MICALGERSGGKTVLKLGPHAAVKEQLGETFSRRGEESFVRKFTKKINYTVMHEVF